MLTFRNTNIFFVIITISLLVTGTWINVALWAYVALILTYLSVVIYGCCNIQSGFFMDVICYANTHEKLVGISFDDGPVPQFTPQVLQALQQHNVPAAFFCIGRNANQNGAILREIHEQGHLIGNHSYTHTASFDFLPWKKMLKDLRLTDKIVRDTIGVELKVFRPPYGVTTPAMKKAVAEGGYTAIGWNLRSLDTISRNENELLQKLMKLLRPGAIILFHDTQQITVSVLSRFIQSARNEGYEFVRLDKLLNLKWYA